MPSTINGIGTWYYGKRNVYTTHDQCEHCHNWADLKSYDTTKYFVAVFIPIIPLGTYRVLNSCPRCTRHYAMKLKEWETLKREEIGKAAQTFREDPGNEKNAIDALVAVVRFQDAASFDRLAGVLQQHHPHNANVQKHLALAYDEFGDLPAAEQALRSSLAAEDAEGTREILAVNLTRQHRPGDATPFVEHVLHQKDEEKMGLLFVQVEGFQAVGNHEAAIELLNRIEEAFPVVAEDKEFKKTRKASTKRLGTRKKVKIAGLKQPTRQKGGGKSGAPLLPRLIGPALGILIAGAYLFAAYSQGRGRKAWVVNGLPIPYHVSIGGVEQRLAPKSTTEVSVGEGEKRIAVLDQGLDIPAETCTIRTSFWVRPFLNRTFVINPDRTALLLWEQVRYSENPDLDEEAPYKLHAGKAFYTFKGIDYHFQDFPEEIRISEGTTARKERVSFLRQFGALDAIPVIAGNLGMEAAVDYLAAYAAAVPTDDACVLTLSALMPPEQFAELARPKLGVRPVLIEWHRMYQTSMQKAHPEHDLVTEYRSLYAQEPLNGDLGYLLARAIPDHDESEGLLTRISQSDRATAYAYGGLSMRRLTMAQFDDALSLIDKALQLSPHSISFGYVRDEALRGLRKFDVLLQENAEARKEAAMDGNLAAERIRLLVANGNANGARTLIKESCDALPNDSPEPANEWRSSLQAVLRYSTGDATGFAKSARSLEGERWPFEIAAATGDFAVAQETFGALEAKSVDDHLLLYAWALAEDADEAAAAHLKEALAALDEGDADDRLIASFLSGAATPADADVVLRMPQEIGRKRIILTAFGQRFPQHRSAYFELARKLNHRRQFPHLLLAHLLGE